MAVADTDTGVLAAVGEADRFEVAEVVPLPPVRLRVHVDLGNPAARVRGVMLREQARAVRLPIHRHRRRVNMRRALSVRDERRVADDDHRQRDTHR